MIDSPKAQLRFQPEWRITLFTLLLVPLMLGLGGWQLQRAEEKSSILQLSQVRQAQAPVPIQGLFESSADQLAYLPVRLQGEYLGKPTFLIDNQIYRGQFGYHVITPFRLEHSERLVLVNRGWIAGDPSRRTLPDIPSVKGPIQLIGHIYVPPGKPYTVGEVTLSETWPKVIPHIEFAAMHQLLNTAEVFFPYQVRLDATAEGGLLIDWKIINVAPEKHTGYALQWFTMAIFLTIFYILRTSNLKSFILNRRGESGI